MPYGERFIAAGLATGAALSVLGTPENPPPEIQYSCHSLTTQLTDLNKYTFEVEPHAVNGAEVRDTLVDYGDGTIDADRPFSHEYSHPGIYVVRAMVRVSLPDGRLAEVGQSDCQAKVTVGEIIDLSPFE